MALVLPALLSSFHLLALALGLGGVFIRGRLLRRPLDAQAWKHLLAADSVWGIAALLWISTGIARVFWNGKDVSFYTRNGLFWVKVALFGGVFLLELWPMVLLIRARIAFAQGRPFDLKSRPTLFRLNTLELGIVLLILLVAPWMARGAWLF